MKNNIVLILVLIIVLSGCATATEIPPTSTPKPTWTMKPHGIFKGCTYYDGELVEGGFAITNMNDNEVFRNNKAGCVEVPLPPGKYSLWAYYFKSGTDCGTDQGCETGRLDLEIVLDEVVEMEFEMKP
jgi:hypothetical protein